MGSRRGGSGLLGYLEMALFLGGAALLVWLVREAGVERLLADVSMIGWGFGLVLAQEALAFSAATNGWIRTIAPAARRVPFRVLAALRVAGDGINHLTPTAAIGGEFVRARLATAYLGARESTASVTLAKFAETTGQIVFISAGLALLLPFLEDLGVYRWWMLAVVVAGTAGVALLGRMLHRGFFAMAARRLSGFGIAPAWFESQAAEIEAVDRLVQDCVRNRPRDLIASVLWFSAAFCASAVEVWIVLYFLGVSAGWHTVIGIEVLSVLIDAVLFFVPAKMGTQEGGKMLIFLTLGLSPEKGLAMGLIRRGREHTWDLAGLLIYAWARRRKKGTD